MSDSITSRINVGAYERPFSGVGIEFAPLANKPGQTGIVLHEAGYLSANRNWKFPSVFSPFWRLYYNQKGGHHVRMGARCVELTPEHIMLIPPHCLCHLLGVSPVPHFWITFSFTRTPAANQALPVLLKPRETELCLIRDAQQLILADKAWDPRDDILGTGMALLHVVLARPELRWKPPRPENMERVRRVIEARFGKALPNAVLAREAGLSVAGFECAFKRHFGTTAARYVTETRVREAAHLLSQTDQTLDAIAAQTGFPNRAYFSRVFKNITAEPPASFRRKHRRTT